MFISNEFAFSFGIYVKLLEFDMAPFKISIPQSRMAAKYNMAASWTWDNLSFYFDSWALNKQRRKESFVWVLA